MGDLAATAVTEISSWSSAGTNGRLLSNRKLTLVLTGQGTLTNKIAAETLGFTKIQSASPAIADGNDHIYVASPSYDGAYLVLKASATDALADITDTVRLTVTGD